MVLRRATYAAGKHTHPRIRPSVLALLLSLLLAIAAAIVPTTSLAEITFQSVDVAMISPTCANDLTIATPVTLSPGDLMLAYIAMSPTWLREVAAPPGWTLLMQVVDGPNLPTWLFYRVAGSLEPPSYTWTFSFLQCWAGVTLSVYRGVDPARPFDSFAGQVNPPSNFQPIPQLTTTGDAEVLVAYYALDWPGTAWTPPNGMTEVADASTGDASLGSAFAIQPIAGPTGERVAVSSPWSSTGLGLLVALRPGPTEPPCAHANPTVALSPARSQGVPAGTPVAYSVSVTNNDSADCTASSFALRATVPSGWTAAFLTSTLTVNPGGSASSTLTITSPAAAPDGSYPIGVTATNSAAPTYAASTSATYVIASSLHLTVATDRSSYTRNQWVSISASVNLGTSPVPNAGVAFTITKPNGAVVTGTATTGTSGSTVYKFRLKSKDPIGTYQVKAAVKVNGVSASAATSFTAQ